MNKRIINEVSRVHELMGLILEQSLNDVQSGSAVLQKGSKGESVKAVQTALMSKGYELPKYGADSGYGDETVAAVKKFQQDNGLNVDGKVGKNTLSKMVSVLNLSVPGAVSTAYEAGKLFGENVKQTLVTIGEITFVIVMAPIGCVIYIAEQIINTTIELGNMLLKFVNELVEMGVAAVKQILEFEREMREKIKKALINAGIQIKKGAEAVWKGIKNLGEGIVKALAFIFGALWSLGKKIYGQALMLAAKIFAGVQQVMIWLEKQWKRVKDAVGETWDSVVSGISSGVDWIKDKASQATGAVKDFFSGFMSVFENYLRNEKLLYERPLDERLIIMEYNSRKNLILN
jgi:phage-related protein